MRIVGLVLTLLVTLSMAAAALTYVQGRTGQDRIYVQGHPGSSPSPSSRLIATGSTDPYHQRYYSESEGWTYYTLPSYSSAAQSDRE